MEQLAPCPIPQLFVTHNSPDAPCKFDPSNVRCFVLLKLLYDFQSVCYDERIVMNKEKMSSVSMNWKPCPPLTLGQYPLMTSWPESSLRPPAPIVIRPYNVSMPPPFPSKSPLSMLHKPPFNPFNTPEGWGCYRGACSTVLSKVTFEVCYRYFANIWVHCMGESNLNIISRSLNRHSAKIL